MRAAFLLLVLAGCFFEGPSPDKPSAATVLLALEPHPLKQDNCMPGRYVGSVAIGGGELGYALTHTYLPSCGGGGMGSSELTSFVYQFEKLGGGYMKVGEAGKTQEGGGARPRIAASATDAVWMFSEMGTNQVQIQSLNGSISGSITPPGGVLDMSSIIVDGTNTFVSAWDGPTGPPNMLKPTYPCCGSSTSQPSPMAFFRLTNAMPTVLTAMPVTPRFATDQIKQSVVANTSSLYYFDVGTTTTTIAGLPKTGSTPETVATVAPNAFPGGIAADDAHVAWLTTLYFPTTGTESSCTINMTTVTAPRTEVQLLSTNKFSCTDVAIGGGHVYFPIVEAFSADSGPLVRNVGIGRIDLVSQVFESIELGIPGPEAGPRQVFVDGDGIIVVAPFVIARIEQRELTGKHEIDK